VTLSFFSALCAVNGLKPDAHELIKMAVAVENNYVGVSSGKLDQSCEIYSRKNQLLYLDTLDDTYELIPTHPQMPDYDIVIFFSGVERTLAGSAFNMRVDEARSAAYALKAFAGMPYGKFGETNLREVPREVYEQYKSRLPETWRRRAEHWYTEFARVEAGAEAWRRGDLQAFGRLSFESGRSSIENWETGSPELKTLYDIMTHTDGIYGGRFSGAGFKGCCMALTNPAFREQITEQVSAAYLREFPDLKGKYSVHICHSADGVMLNQS
ncbi:MAG: galactokinase, partial [Bacteroidaceae bacterium]|nr:galactokinase [Bacteroidaceae bacterium]